jgi:hypothetical protein
MPVNSHHFECYATPALGSKSLHKRSSQREFARFCEAYPVAFSAFCAMRSLLELSSQDVKVKS